MKYFHFLLLGILLPFFSNAQSNFLPGYVINIKGDTIKGFIDYREWQKNPKSFNFRTAPNNPISPYSIYNSIGFGIYKIETFKSFIVSKSIDKVDVENASYKPDTSIVIDTVFLKVIKSGKNVTLFSLQDDIKLRFYVLKNNETQPFELTYRVNLEQSEQTGQYYLKELKKYKGQILDLVNDNKIKENLGRKIKYSSYNETDLSKIIDLINNNEKSNIHKLSEIKYYCGLGVNYSTLNITQIPANNFLANMVYHKNSIYPELNAGIKYIFNKYTQRFIINLEYEGLVNKYNISTYDNSGLVPSRNFLNFNQFSNIFGTYLVINIIAKPNFQLFLSSGILFNFSTYSKHSLVTDYGSISETSQNNIPVFNNFLSNYAFKSGVTIKNQFEFFLKYITSSPIANSFQKIRLEQSSLHLGINYIF